MEEKTNDTDWLDEALGPYTSPPSGEDPTEMDTYLEGALGPDGWLTAELSGAICPKCGEHNCTAHEVQAPEQAPEQEVEPVPTPETVYTTREEWLQAAVGEMAPWYAALDHGLPSNLRVSCGWTGAGKRGKRIGECWSQESSGDGAVEIFVSPVLAEPIRVLDVLAHELVHAAVGNEHKHGKVFKRAALAIGLEGKMTQTRAGPVLQERLAEVYQVVGAYPHAELAATATSSGPPKQTTRLVKVGCGECGVVARMTKKWIDQDKLPICQCGCAWEVLG